MRLVTFISNATSRFILLIFVSCRVVVLQQIHLIHSLAWAKLDLVINVWSLVELLYTVVRALWSVLATHMCVILRQNHLPLTLACLNFTWLLSLSEPHLIHTLSIVAGRLYNLSCAWSTSISTRSWWSTSGLPVHIIALAWLLV